MTLGTLIVIKEIGLKIPNDIGIAGFDDPDWNIILDPSSYSSRSASLQSGFNYY